MPLEIRPAGREEMEDFGHAAFTSLVLSPEVMPREVIRGIRPEWTLCAFEDGKLATSYAAWPFTMQLGEATVAVAGITCVGTLPVYRGRSHLRGIIAEHFRILHERGSQPIAALYASRAAIYQRHGFAVVTTRNAYRIEPGYLEFAVPLPSKGRVRECKSDEIGILAGVYGAFREGRTGFFGRGNALWKTAILRAPSTEGKLLNVILYEEEGKAQGYAVYTAEPLEAVPGGPWHVVHIRDLAWLTPSAYRSIWDCLAKMKLAREIIWDRVPPGDPLPHLLLEPRTINVTSQDGVLARLIDINRALASREYPVEAALCFDVMDELCPWNQGCWRLETGPESHIAKSHAPPDLTIPVSTLAMLLFGQISATEAAHMGRLAVRNERALAEWDRVFRPKHRPFCPDMF